MSDMHERGFCPRCLLSRSPEGEALAALLEQWIDAIPEGDRTGEAQYEDRLSACQSCDQLNAGVCGLCGCYAAYRAARANTRCPGVPPKW